MAKNSKRRTMMTVDDIMDKYLHLLPQSYQDSFVHDILTLTSTVQQCLIETAKAVGAWREIPASRQ